MDRLLGPTRISQPRSRGSPSPPPAATPAAPPPETGSWRHLITAQSDDSQTLVVLLLDKAADSPDPARLAAGIAARDRAVADLRDQLSNAKAALQPLSGCTHDLAAELRNYREDEHAALSAKVMHMRIVE